MKNFFIIYSVLVSFLFSCRDRDTSKLNTKVPIDTLEMYNQLLENNNKLDSIFYKRALWLLKQSQLDSAIADLNKAIHLMPGEPLYTFSLSDAYLLRLDSKSALQVLDSLQLRLPDNLDLKLKKARLQLILKNYKDAMRELEFVYLLDPQNSQAHYLAGHIFYEQGDTGRAVKSYQKAVDLNPEFVESWNQLGDIMMNLKNPLAIRYYENALRIDTNNIETMHNKAYALQLFNRKEEAILEYKKIIDKRPDFELSYFNLGLLNLEKDSLDQALYYLTEAIKLNPEEASNYYYRAKTYLKQGKKNQAKNDLTLAITIFPKYIEAQKLLKEF